MFGELFVVPVLVWQVPLNGPLLPVATFHLVIWFVLALRKRS
jgi:hypothetical protein